MLGTTNHSICPLCGNSTVDSEVNCHYAYCDEMSLDLDDEALIAHLDKEIEDFHYSQYEE